MNILGFTLTRAKQAPMPAQEAPKTSSDSMHSFSLGAETDLPLIIESRNADWVLYGEDNLYPEYLKEMYNTSPTHNAIVKTKAQMVVGEGWEFSEDFITNSPEKDIIIATQLALQIQKHAYDLSLDYQLYGAMAIEVIWSLDHSRIVELNRLDPACIRSGKFEDGKVSCYYYKRNWADRREDEVEIERFDRADLDSHRQLLYIAPQKVSNEYYGEPSYLGAMDWINLESQVGLYYKSLIENGFNPSLLIKYYRKPANQEDREDLVNGLKRSFGGVKRAGKAMVIFSDGKELAPDITPVDVQNVDKQFVVIADQITQKILTGERATTPELFGLSVPGQLGSGDFETKVKCFEKFVIRPDQRVFESAVNELYASIGMKTDFTLKPMTI